MKYQVLGHKRKLELNQKPYDVICEFDDLVQLYFMMDKVDPYLYDDILVIDTYTNRLVASRDLKEPYIRNLRKKR